MTTSSTQDADLRESITAQRREVAEMLSGLPSQSWDAPTLCAGWRVREVVAHMTMPFRYSTRQFLAELGKARGNFNRMADRSARRTGRCRRMTSWRRSATMPGIHGSRPAAGSRARWSTT
jgi:uncharacterized protein (TIGR03083 family)